MRESIPWSEMVDAARMVRRHAHAPYSRFAVGAALVDVEGTIHTGCNVENASYGLTLCAERSAVVAAIAQGARTFRGLAIVSTGHVAPCGACRQVLAEFCGEDLPIWLVEAEPEASEEMVVRSSLRELFPAPFSGRSLPTA